MDAVCLYSLFYFVHATCCGELKKLLLLAIEKIYLQFKVKQKLLLFFCFAEVLNLVFQDIFGLRKAVP
jgi:hypothetical protein